MLGYLQIAFLAVVIIVSYTIGGKVTKGVWEPAYLGVAKSLSDLQKDYNLERVKASGDADTVTVYLQGKTEVREENHEAREAEITRRVDAYIASLNRVWPVPKEGDTGSSGTAHLLSEAPRLFGITSDNGAKLARNLGFLEEGVIRRLIHREMTATTRNLMCKEYLEEVESEMAPLRKKYQETINSQ